MFWVIKESSALKKAPQKYGACNYNLIASSIIQTLLSVSELHRIGRRSGSRTVTAGRELHPTPKILYFVSYNNCIATICQEQNETKQMCPQVVKKTKTEPSPNGCYITLPHTGQNLPEAEAPHEGHFLEPESET